VEVVLDDPLRARVLVSRTLGVASRLEQVYELDAESPVLAVRTRVDWRERRRWLRAEFPTSIVAERWTGQIQCGVVERPAHENWAADRMMFECCAHRWTDLSEPGCGLAILNDGHYGHACRDGVLALSLLRSPVWPDPQADQGVHEFAYGLMPHGGDWRTAAVDERAALFNTPLRVVERTGPAARPGGSDASREAGAAGFGVVHVETVGAGAVEVSAVKPGDEDPSTIVVRLCEVRGGRCSARVRWGVGVSGVRVVDAVERATPTACDHADGVTRVEVPRFGIVTLLAVRSE
jgi:alpha-mannosidase